jgi:hypothetical protein
MQNAAVLNIKKFYAVITSTSIPKELYKTISRAARIENRNISQQTVVLLKKALNITGERMARRK